MLHHFWSHDQSFLGVNAESQFQLDDVTSGHDLTAGHVTNLSKCIKNTGMYAFRTPVKSFLVT